MKEDQPYINASPDLFGAEFAKNSKDFLDQVKALWSSLSRNEVQYLQGSLFFGPANPRGGQGPTNEVEPRTSTNHTGEAVETGEPTKTKTEPINVSNYCQRNFKNYPLSI